MTIEFEKHIVENAFAPNTALTITSEGMNAAVSVAIVEWALEGTTCEFAHKHCGYVAANTLYDCIEEGRLWLLACSGVIPRATPLTDYYKLWKFFERSGQELPQGSRSEEHYQKTHQGWRWFSGICFDVIDLEKALKTVEYGIATSTVAMACVPGASSSAIDSVIASGWSRASLPERPSPQLVEAVVKAQGALLHPVGTFDDRRAGVVAFASPMLAQRLYEHELNTST